MVDFGPVFSFQLSGRQRVVGCFHFPDYQITHLPNSAELPRKPGNLQYRHLVKERFEERHTLGRCRIVADSVERIKSEIVSDNGLAQLWM